MATPSCPPELAGSIPPQHDGGLAEGLCQGNAREFEGQVGGQSLIPPEFLSYRAGNYY